MQLLLYVYSCLIVIVFTSVFDLYSRFSSLTSSTASHGTIFIIETLIMSCSYAMSLLLICTLTNFLKFHLKLVLENYTTIENLEREEGAKSKFDIGRRRNWEQVFGTTWYLWPYPAHTLQSRPVGDGVRWRVHYTRVIDEDEELPAEG